ncbi:pentapeptide repeat-containing protein [Microbispora sp. GKU 823]|uniref:pentapeptide repeat-containing protein n=1 Tax=Microbispora sp. GKU 823 TaxID=1652100 RepID=UPI0009CD69BF|nr:pentapeptide repeat-containing protein [Microbispora sp. GKU 823]OPG09288.1 hypothetical protein B1L11_26130 [Microbispora sp. GKU 823]
MAEQSRIELLEQRLSRLREPRSAGWWIALAVVLTVSTVALTGWLLLRGVAAPSARPVATGSASSAPTPTGPTSVEVSTATSEAIRTALTAGAAVGAAFTLALAFRRQRHQELTMVLTALQAERDAAFAERDAERDAAHAERVAEDNQRDALERRITELYTKAAEQLGHDKAAVRLAGMYALERLAQDNEGHRQTIVNVICAYLRMPYRPPTPSDPEQERREALRAARRRYHATRNGHSGVTQPADHRVQGGDPEGERQVRLTAQRILADHLRDDRPVDERETPPPGLHFWDGIRIDLTGATLIDFDFSHCRVAVGVFREATFSRMARFHGTTFAEANFRKATFAGEVRFFDATFAGEAYFSEATFAGAAWFGEATFAKFAYFWEATFAERSYFREATFGQHANFSQGTFARKTWFDEATFGQLADFSRATFSGGANFNGMIGSISLEWARVTDPGEGYQWPPGWHVVIRPDGSSLIKSASERQPPEAGASQQKA